MKPQKAKSKFFPIIILILLSPILAEILSNSSPPAEFFQPHIFLILVAMYGSGVLIVRELSLKWNKGWLSILLLGAAYGIVEEGLIAKSFFDPNWVDLGILGTYGRWLEVNWLWTVGLIIFHAVYSIAIPILIFHFLFPYLKKERLLKTKGLVISFIVLFLVFLVANKALSTYTLSGGQYLLSFIAIIVLVLAARFIRPQKHLPKTHEPTKKPSRFMLLGAIFGFLFYFIMYGVPNIIPIVIIPIALEIILCFVVWKYLIKNIGITNNSSQKLAFLTGALLVMFTIALVFGFRGDLSMIIVVVLFILFLFYLRKKIKNPRVETHTKYEQEKNINY